MTTPQQAAFDLMTAAPSLIAEGMPHRDVDGLQELLQDFCGVVDLEGVLDGLDENDCRAWVAVVFWLMISSDYAAAALRERAELVLTARGRGPVHDQAGFSRALLRSAEILA